MLTTGSEDCLQIKMHSQKFPGTYIHLKQPREDKKKGVIYEVPCKDCECVYIGETGRTLEKRLTDHKNAVKKHDTKNGIAVYF